MGLLKSIKIIGAISLCLAAALVMPLPQRDAAYKISETELKIPKDFLFLSPVRQNGDGGIVAFLWPEMKPRSGKYYSEFSVPGGGNVVRVRMSASMNWDGLTEVYHAGKIWGGSFGLKSAIPAKPYGMSGWTYFIAPADGIHEESYLACLNGPVPQCTHEIKYRDFYIAISYRQALLPDWKNIRDASFDLLNQWENSQ